MSQHERRREPRYPVHRPVRITLPDGSELEAITRDLSANGLGICSPHRLPAGLHLNLTLAEGPAHTPMQLWSNVQFCAQAPQPDGFSLGLRHHQPPAAYRGLLCHLRQSRWHQTKT